MPGWSFITSRQIRDVENFTFEHAVLASVFSKHNHESKLKEAFPRMFQKFGYKRTASIHSTQDGATFYNLESKSY